MLRNRNDRRVKSRKDPRFFIYTGSLYSKVWGLVHLPKPPWLASQAVLGIVISSPPWAMEHTRMSSCHSSPGPLKLAEALEHTAEFEGLSRVVQAAPMSLQPLDVAQKQARSAPMCPTSRVRAG